MMWFYGKNLKMWSHKGVGRCGLIRGLEDVVS